MASATMPERARGIGRAGISPEEWQTRVDLAAAYRLAALHGWTDLDNTHFSARIPGTEHFLLNPFGLLFDRSRRAATGRPRPRRQADPPHPPQPRPDDGGRGLRVDVPDRDDRAGLRMYGPGGPGYRE